MKNLVLVNFLKALILIPKIVTLANMMKKKQSSLYKVNVREYTVMILIKINTLFSK